MSDRGYALVYWSCPFCKHRQSQYVNLAELNGNYDKVLVTCDDGDGVGCEKNSVLTLQMAVMVIEPVGYNAPDG